MKWTQITIETTCEAVDLLSAFLDEEGVLGIEVDDNVPLTDEEMAAMFVDLLPDEMQENSNMYLRTMIPFLQQRHQVFHLVINFSLNKKWQ